MPTTAPCPGTGQLTNNKESNLRHQAMPSQASTSAGSVQYELFERQLLESAKNSLRYELYGNASFLCERLLAQIDNEEVRLLLAESYLGEGKAYKAYEVLKGCTTGPNRYKLALTCVKLNQLAEAEKVLLE